MGPGQRLRLREFQCISSKKLTLLADPMAQKILVVDDDVSFCLTLKAFLERNGFVIREAYNSQKALEKMAGERFDVVLTDFRLPDMDGLELLKQIRQRSSAAVVIIMTAYADIRMAVQAIKYGAYEYVAKPVNPDELLAHIRNGLKKKEQLPESGPVGQKASKPARLSFDYQEAQSKQSREIHEHIKLVAPTHMSVVIMGESGTGKEYIARRIHAFSKRKDHPFVAVDCGALSEELAASEFFGHLKGSFTGAIQDKTGQFEAANKGTLFLDEIGNLSYDIQVKLLRALQERQIRKIGSNKDIPVDVRILAATNDDLQKEVQRGNFREDLYHRLNEFSILVPPLRERKEDVQIFVNYFLKKANEELEKQVDTIPDGVMDILLNYSWPGNIREIKNVIRRAVLLTSGVELDKTALPQEIVFAALTQDDRPTDGNEENSLKSETGKTEKEIIVSTLQKAKYNKSKAARMLNIDRRTLYNKMKLYNIPLD